MATTDGESITGGTRSELGYWTLTTAPGEKHVSRTDFAEPGADPTRAETLLTVAHLSDLHVCDSQSPARAEFLDRWADDDSPLKEHVDEVGSYRAQDMLTVQVAAAMVQAVNAVPVGPVGGAPVDWAICTGDVVDSAQRNELDWYVALLDGGVVTPDSGDPARYEGVADNVVRDEYFWHPEPSAEHGPDRPQRLHGFPTVPGLLDAVRRPFHSPGLGLPWLAVHGNHDQHSQGLTPVDSPFGRSTTGSAKAIGVPAGWPVQQVAGFLSGLDGIGGSEPAEAQWAQLVTRYVTPDPQRRPISRHEFNAAHFGAGSRPERHGLAPDSDVTGRSWYRFDHSADVTVLVLDTVNEFGGWQGCLDREQFGWLRSELTAADRERRYVVLASHHTLADLVNPVVPVGTPNPAQVEEVRAELADHPSLVLWLNGHTHITAVTGHPGASPWWEVTAPSLIDFPQQGRIVELLRSGGVLTVAATMLDHAGELPWSGSIATVPELAGLSRELAANAWQWRTEHLDSHARAGRRVDRNVLLHLPDPFAGATPD